VVATSATLPLEMMMGPRDRCGHTVPHLCAV